MKHFLLIPVFNDWKSVNKLISKLNVSLRINKKIKNEILIINDNSSEKVNLNLKRLKSISKIKIIYLKKNFGSQKAIFKHESFFSDSFIFCRLLPQGIHGYNASWLHFKKLYNCFTGGDDCVIVRATEVGKKRGIPDRFQLMQTVEKYGESIYKIPARTLRLNE